MVEMMQTLPTSQCLAVSNNAGGLLQEPESKDYQEKRLLPPAGRAQRDQGRDRDGEDGKVGDDVHGRGEVPRGVDGEASFLQGWHDGGQGHAGQREDQDLDDGPDCDEDQGVSANQLRPLANEEAAEEQQERDLDEVGAGVVGDDDKVEPLRGTKRVSRETGRKQSDRGSAYFHLFQRGLRGY